MQTAYTRWISQACYLHSCYCDACRYSQPTQHGLRAWHVTKQIEPPINLLITIITHIIPYACTIPSHRMRLQTCILSVSNPQICVEYNWQPMSLENNHQRLKVAHIANTISLSSVHTCDWVAPRRLFHNSCDIIHPRSERLAYVVA